MPDTFILPALSAIDGSDGHLREVRIAGESILEGRFLQARRDQVRLPDGASSTREYIVHPGAVVVVPLLDDGRVVLERQFRYPVGQVVVEFPAGKLDPEEAPLHCGQRELLEETGFTAREWARAGAMHLAVGYSTEVIHVYFARGLVAGKPSLDLGEFVDVFAASLDELLEWCRSGKVTDAKTLAYVVHLQNMVSGGWALEWHAGAAGDAAPPAGSR